MVKYVICVRLNEVGKERAKNWFKLDTEKPIFMSYKRACGMTTSLQSAKFFQNADDARHLLYSYGGKILSLNLMVGVERFSILQVNVLTKYRIVDKIASSEPSQCTHKEKGLG